MVLTAIFQLKKWTYIKLCKIQSTEQQCDTFLINFVNVDVCVWCLRCICIVLRKKMQIFATIFMQTSRFTRPTKNGYLLGSHSWCYFDDFHLTLSAITLYTFSSYGTDTSRNQPCLPAYLLCRQPCGSTTTRRLCGR